MTRTVAPGAGPVFAALDWTFELVGDVELVDFLADALTDLATDVVPQTTVSICGHDDGRWELDAPGETTYTSAPANIVADVLTMTNRRAVGSLHDGVALHAAAVETPHGVIAFAGHSGAGKSTLAAAAVMHGFGFVADEVTTVDPVTLAVRPYHRPVGLRIGGARALGLEVPDADDRHSRVWPWVASRSGSLSAGGRLIGVVLVERHDGPASVEERSQAEGLFAIARHALWSERVQPDVFRSSEAIARAVPVVTSRHEEPAAAIDALVDRFSPRGH